jgi:hypothetical protein
MRFELQAKMPYLWHKTKQFLADVLNFPPSLKIFYPIIFFSWFEQVYQKKKLASTAKANIITNALLVLKLFRFFQIRV